MVSGLYYVFLRELIFEAWKEGLHVYLCPQMKAQLPDVKNIVPSDLFTVYIANKNDMGLFFDICLSYDKNYDGVVYVARADENPRKWHTSTVEDSALQLALNTLCSCLIDQVKQYLLDKGITSGYYTKIKTLS